jgi:CheY-like chemotaxis protein
MSSTQARENLSEKPSLPALLVVEDEVLIRFLVAEALRAAGFSVIEAANADEALKVLATSAPVDVLITDVDMPGAIDGLGLAPLARSARPGLRVVIASGCVGSEAAADAADLFIGKPYDPEHMVWRVRGLTEAATAS